jgi:hypothetical protein
VYWLPSFPAIVTAVAFVALTLRIEDPPETTEVGFAEMVTVGAGVDCGTTVTVAVAVALPDAPVAVAVYVVVTAGDTVCVPSAGVSV